MNNILELKGKPFLQAAKPTSTSGGASMNSKRTVDSEHILLLITQLEEIISFWQQEMKLFDGILISVQYNKIIAKSNRISGLFKKNRSNDAIIGAKFTEDKTKHIITYLLEEHHLVETIQVLEIVHGILKSEFSSSITKATFDNSEIINRIPFKKFHISKSKFKQVIADVSYIDCFKVESAQKNLKESIITLFDTNINTQVLLKHLGIDILASRMLDNQTVLLDEQQLSILFEKAPYLVAMATENLSDLSPEDFSDEYQNEYLKIPVPKSEPIIGVIDTLFDTRVYFSDWVEYHNLVDENIPIQQKDYNHGTAVSSIIVEGARLNSWLDDGCGRFRVRHFGVATGSSFSSFTVAKQIKKIISENQDIKVWNLSLGSNQEINDNFISAQAAILDQLQSEYDIIFVIAGTNKPNDNIVKIGSPADSINSMVVNAVTKSGLSTSYTRKGLALSFFAKPDVSYYGGSQEQWIRVCEPLGEANVAGTSFAAPWIARKLAYLIEIIGMKRELAKALIIDAARGWEAYPTPEEVAIYGHGVVPIKIDDILKTQEDEIKFLITDISEKWNTYNYNFPIPLKDNKYPYITRATMCYFPKCNRMQGVDYTNTELNLHFGRINDASKLNEINQDKQNQSDFDGKNYILEGDARARFRKWDNVKYISELPKNRNMPKKSYTNKNWGMEIKTNNRLDPIDGIGIRFGVVVTLKEINGVNRIDEFIRACTLSGWLVNEVDIQKRISLNQQVQEEIIFD
ncbi:MAG: S8 family peptidase [Culicoidibacterales bacterium]